MKRIFYSASLAIVFAVVFSTNTPAQSNGWNNGCQDISPVSLVGNMVANGAKHIITADAKDDKQLDVVLTGMNNNWIAFVSPEMGPTCLWGMGENWRKTDGTIRGHPEEGLWDNWHISDKGNLVVKAPYRAVATWLFRLNREKSAFKGDLLENFGEYEFFTEPGGGWTMVNVTTQGFATVTTSGNNWSDLTIRQQFLSPQEYPPLE